MKFIFLLFPVLAFSHPVIYKDGIVYNGTFMPEMNIQRLGYSLRYDWAIETNSHHFKRINNYRDYTVGINHLFKRWLQFDSQGNLYGGVHTGYYDDDKTNGSVTHLMLMADWEDRDYYTAATTKAFFYNDEIIYKHLVRFGIAPYVAGMNTLQSWLILQLDYFEEHDDDVLIAPILRLFYKNVLWEIGSNTKGETFLTLMVHF